MSRRTKLTSDRELVTLLTEQLKRKDEELFQTKQNIDVLKTALKAFGYAAGTTFAIFICLSNSLHAIAQTLWSDVGNNWAYLWNILQTNFSGVALFIGGSMLLHLLVFWVYGGFLLYLDLYKPHLLAQFKVQPGTNAPVDREKLMKCVKAVLRNQFLISLPMNIISYPIVKYCGVSLTLPLPSFNQVLLELVFFTLVEEILFYYGHRLFHNRYFYGRFHKIHHEWTAPIGIACIYAHPVEHLLCNLLPILIGPMLLGSHLATIWVWQTLAVVTTINSHSGYHLPFMPSPEAHDFHHLRFNQNYGVLGLLDYLHGTDSEFRASEQYKQHHTLFSTAYTSTKRPGKVLEEEEDKTLADVLQASASSLLSSTFDSKTD